MHEKVYCGSDVIEKDLIEASGVHEYPDGVLVNPSDCLKCSVNCPKNPNGYTKEQVLKLNIDRYKTFSF